MERLVKGKKNEKKPITIWSFEIKLTERAKNRKKYRVNNT